MTKIITLLAAALAIALIAWFYFGFREEAGSSQAARPETVSPLQGQYGSPQATFVTGQQYNLAPVRLLHPHCPTRGVNAACMDLYCKLTVISLPVRRKLDTIEDQAESFSLIDRKKSLP